MSYRTVYFMKPVGMDGPIKIGCTNMPIRRLKQLGDWCPFPLEIIGTFPGSPADEHEVQRRFAQHRSHGEWFRPAGELLEFIAALGLPAAAFEAKSKEDARLAS